MRLLQKLSLKKKLINQKNSIFSKILIPTIVVMLFQVVLISAVLIINGTIASLEKSATESLLRNAENRSITLENMMVHTWSNLDKLESDIAAIIEKAAGADIHVRANEEKLLGDISDALLYSLRMTATTGTFMFFIDDEAASSEQADLFGLYYRDFNPNMTPADYSDVLFEKGPAAIARKHAIPLSSLWSEMYTIEAAYPTTWNALMAPYKAAGDNPGLKSANVALWSDAHYLDPHSKLDSNSFISYTRPLIVGGKPIGIIGIEVQTEYLKRYFPAADLGDMGGYMLLHYYESAKDSPDSQFTVGATSGSYIKRLGDFGTELNLTRAKEQNIFTSHSESFVPTTLAMQPLKLYNSNAPFSERKWALAALMPDSILFENSQRITGGVLSSSLIALGLGCVLLVISIRMATRPLLSIASQIKDGNTDDLVLVQNTNTYEINLLCDTINEMKRKRKDVEIALREEGERYMLALESAIDTFIEYDLIHDQFRLYFFAGESEKQALTSKVINSFKRDNMIDALCHPADAKDFWAVLSGQRTEGCEMRLHTNIFPPLADTPTDGDYYWFSFKAIQIRTDDKTLEKTIGSAKQITAEKLAEIALREAARRDLTTGTYNREYGNLLLVNRSDDVIPRRKSTCLLAITVSPFEDFEAYYGRVFSAALLQDIGRELLALRPAISPIIRWSNAAFVAFCAKEDLALLSQKIDEISTRLYSGENPDLKLHIYAGASQCGTDWELTDYLEQSFAAAHAAQIEHAATLLYDPSMHSLKRSTLKRSDDVQYVQTEISKETIVGFAFSLFEQTNDIKSVMHMLLRVLGKLFEMRRIIVCEYDEDFGSNQVLNQWTSTNVLPYSADMERIEQADFAFLSSRLNELGVLSFNSDDAKTYSDGARRLLCIGDDAEFSALCCAMYEGGTHTGRTLFISADKNRKLSDSDVFSLYEITKIVCTRLNLEKSNSASRAKSEFLSKMSHEIRTPMNAIIGLTRIAREAGHDSTQIQNCLEKIDSSAKHLLSLINDVLDMSRIESGKLSIDKRPFSLAMLVSNLDTLMRPQFEDKEISFVVAPELSQTGIVGDEQKLRQVLINLLGNACKFTPQGGTVTFQIMQTLFSDRRMCTCRFSVADTGVGIAKADQFNIFNAFEQSAAGNIAAGNPQGTGLGLAISNSLVSAMGGRIELNSIQGKGSDFFFTLEFECDDSIAGGPAGISPISRDRFKGKRALIVDDNDINLEIATYIVSDIGFECEVAKDGKQAIDLFFASEPGYFDIIFMDISMPVMDGLTATREIRKFAERSDSRTIPIIAMTANAFSDDTRKSIEAGMNAHVAKPIDVDFLYMTLETLFPPDNA